MATQETQQTPKIVTREDTERLLNTTNIDHAKDLISKMSSEE